jgi:hypothetical protein
MTMKCIVTKYLGPTTFRGARIKAVISGGRHSLTIDYPHELDSEAAHWKAASELIRRLESPVIRRLEWPAVYHGAELQTGYVFVPDVGQGRTA